MSMSGHYVLGVVGRCLGALRWPGRPRDLMCFSPTPPGTHGAALLLGLARGLFWCESRAARKEVNSYEAVGIGTRVARQCRADVDEQAAGAASSLPGLSLGLAACQRARRRGSFLLAVRHVTREQSAQKFWLKFSVGPNTLGFVGTESISTEFSTWRWAPDARSEGAPVERSPWSGDTPP